MQSLPKKAKSILAASIFLAALAGAVWLWIGLRPAAAAGSAQAFEVAEGSGFRAIVHDLAAAGVIRSAAAFEVYEFLTGRARRIAPGKYELNPASSGAEISAALAAGPDREATVTIPEGSTAADIDAMLAKAGVTPAGKFLAAVHATSTPLEGHLFPDTYRFYFASDPQDVIRRLMDNFENRVAPLLAADPAHADRNLILASILEKEVPGQDDREIVAGILLKRAAAGMPLQVDAGLCYAKQLADPSRPCHPLTSVDKKIKSPYNTYLNSGWPPGAISNPGVLAVEAALHPKDSPYWYYLSDPKSGRTIFAASIEEQVKNQQMYLNNN